MVQALSIILDLAVRLGGTYNRNLAVSDVSTQQANKSRNLCGGGSRRCSRGGMWLYPHFMMPVGCARHRHAQMDAVYRRAVAHAAI